MRRLAEAGEPLEPREHSRAAAERGVVAAFPVEPNRTLDGLERLVEAPREVNGCALLEHRRTFTDIEIVEEVQCPPVVGVRLATRPERSGTAGRGQHVRGDNVVVARRFCVVDDVGGVAGGGEQRVHHTPMESKGRHRGQVRQDRLSNELVPELHVCRLDLEQPPPLGIVRRRPPVRRRQVENRARYPAGHDRDELDQLARASVEANDASEDGVRDRGR